MDLRRVVDLPLYVFDVVDEWKAEAHARGEDVVDFGIGSPDRGAPQPIVETLVEAARDARHHGYPTSPGTLAVRAALAAWYARRYGVELDPERQTLVTWGASEALSHLPWVLLGPGDTALVPEPCYPIHYYSVLFSGAEPVPVPIGADNDIAAEVERAWAGAGDEGAGARTRPRALILSFPHNPTTRCVELDTLARLVPWARRHDVVIVHDFAYAEIAFDGYRAPSILQVPGAADVAVELVSLSKSHNMAGWRLGFVAGNAQVIAGLARLKSYLDYGVSTPVQRMGLTALTQCDDTPAEAAALYQRRRDLLCDGLAACGWPVARPRGTMFVWAPIPEAFRELGSLRFAEHLLRLGAVAVSPGIGFGDAGDGHVRFALVQNEERMAQALAGIGRALDQRPRTPGGRHGGRRWN